MSACLESLALIIPLIIILMEITDQSENVAQMRKNHIGEAFKIINLFKQRGVWWPTHNYLLNWPKRDALHLFPDI